METLKTQDVHRRNETYQIVIIDVRLQDIVN